MTDVIDFFKKLLDYRESGALSEAPETEPIAAVDPGIGFTEDRKSHMGGSIPLNSSTLLKYLFSMTVTNLLHSSLFIFCQCFLNEQNILCQEPSVL